MIPNIHIDVHNLNNYQKFTVLLTHVLLVVHLPIKDAKYGMKM